MCYFTTIGYYKKWDIFEKYFTTFVFMFGKRSRGKKYCIQGGESQKVVNCLKPSEKKKVSWKYAYFVRFEKFHPRNSELNGL